MTTVCSTSELDHERKPVEVRRLHPWDAKPFDLDVFTWQDKPDGYFFNYWVRILKEFEKCLSLSRLTFYLISNHILVR